MPTTKEQQRAAFALRIIIGGKQIKKETASFLAGAPAQIMQNGLGQAMAFWAAKAEKEDDKHTLAFKGVAGWLTAEKITSSEEKIQFLTNLNTMDVNTYLQAQAEALAFLQWLKRYAKAFQTNN